MGNIYTRGVKLRVNALCFESNSSPKYLSTATNNESDAMGHEFCDTKWEEFNNCLDNNYISPLRYSYYNSTNPVDKFKIQVIW